MGTVVEIRDFNIIRAIGRMRRIWKTAFPEELTPRTTMKDLSDKSLMTLALMSQAISSMLNRLIAAAYEADLAAGFENLDNKTKVKIIDATLFFTDQVRWECLGRLRWVKGYAAEEYPIVELILYHDRLKADFRPRFPELRDTHPKFEEFDRRRCIDGESMIRSLIPAALAAFGARLH